MKLGKRTAKLVREAAIAGFVAGNYFGPPPLTRTEEFPLDAEIWVLTLRTARKFPDIYPILKNVARESEELAGDDRRAATATAEFLSGLREQEKPQ